MSCSVPTNPFVSGRRLTAADLPQQLVLELSCPTKPRTEKGTGDSLSSVSTGLSSPAVSELTPPWTGMMEEPPEVSVKVLLLPDAEEDIKDSDLLSATEEERRWAEVGTRLCRVFADADSDSDDGIVDGSDSLSAFAEQRRWAEVGKRLSHIFADADADRDRMCGRVAL
eukprot:gnl/TRDRNA2_/TRDRNA2_155708_c0_seq1.p2 gnl/TRDRNA2_/TRDRNA2_155708_c0~~gnl/TRDRNA2_/TRDRNA2_155708_c0_seq1.p2  ORF type:complete len:169 (-),score=20.41 gnl/TRDRNA2_/TRDRNA2_155708_c0_seq1:562-1068(-)